MGGEYNDDEEDEERRHFSWHTELLFCSHYFSNSNSRLFFSPWRNLRYSKWNPGKVEEKNIFIPFVLLYLDDIMQWTIERKSRLIILYSRFPFVLFSFRLSSRVGIYVFLEYLTVERIAMIASRRFIICEMLTPVGWKSVREWKLLNFSGQNVFIIRRSLALGLWGSFTVKLQAGGARLRQSCLLTHR